MVVWAELQMRRRAQANISAVHRLDRLDEFLPREINLWKMFSAAFDPPRIAPLNSRDSAECRRLIYV
jgi:hypothetical protein